jgi:hypothetical protein
MNLKRLARVSAGGFATEKTGGFKHRLRCDAMIFEQKKERPPAHRAGGRCSFFCSR